MIILRHAMMIDISSNTVRDICVDGIENIDNEIAFSVGHLKLGIQAVYEQYLECQTGMFYVLPVQCKEDWVTYYHMTGVDIKSRSILWTPTMEELKYVLCLYVLEHKILTKDAVHFLLAKAKSESTGKDGTLALLIQSICVLCYIYLYMFFGEPLPKPLAARLKNYQLYKQSAVAPMLRIFLFGKEPQKYKLYTDHFLYTLLYNVKLTEFVLKNIKSLKSPGFKIALIKEK
ncbi:tegument protein U75 [Elephant endotheliotropic herpesvirus 1A]|uniref:U75 n=3 Tax=Elephantid herpesvirus 1 TaxID=146015 RepID=E2IKY7_ELHV1|nr:tegument protein UL7 [Elephantid betaherpesvirus 1]ADK70813.1 U75 [Elephant endotheliotropic herpesvirus 1A]AGE10067.1 tegument protein UL7 [Elephantid betaherpesvirus 1]AGG16111.1 tegument protein U75 [Elephant endotheliotropic herpesvirus 1A]QOE74620.1 tegument protein U75 [Elephant endotheliotropic herpesvirus 1A]QOE74737.1 tegument protein U75 [Elephant endotheliotropic herpesvirus 1A]